MATGQPDTENVIFWIALTALVMIGLALVIVWISRVAVTRIEEEREKRQQEALANQRKLLATSLISQEKERKRIAADLHDELSSRLNVLRLKLFAIEHNDPDRMEQAVQLLDEALHVSRTLSHELYPPFLAEVGLEEALRDFVNPLAETMEVDVRVLHGGRSVRFDPQYELQLFRVAQEVI